MIGSPADCFCDHFGIRTARSHRDLLTELGHAFGRLPYENLTKLIKKRRVPAGPGRRRLPDEVLGDHLEHGTGGTCFALNELFAAVLSRLGVFSHRVLCDTRHRPQGHCALVVHLPQGPHLMDPGYLLHEPLRLVALAGGESRGAARLLPVDREATVFDLFTYGVWRYRFGLAAAPADRYLAAWDSSFDWPMMNGIHLCVPTGRGYAYVHNHTLCLRGCGTRQNINIRGLEEGALADRFAIDPAVVVEAYRVLSEHRDGVAAGFLGGGGHA